MGKGTLHFLCTAQLYKNNKDGKKSSKRVKMFTLLVLCELKEGHLAHCHNIFQWLVMTSLVDLSLLTITNDNLV